MTYNGKVTYLPDYTLREQTKSKKIEGDTKTFTVKFATATKIFANITSTKEIPCEGKVTLTCTATTTQMHKWTRTLKTKLLIRKPVQTIKLTLLLKLNSKEQVALSDTHSFYLVYSFFK